MADQFTPRHPEYYVRIIRTHEWANRQLVSLLDLDQFGKGRIRAMWRIGITTAAMLRDADPEDVFERLREYARTQKPRDVIAKDKQRGIEMIRGWQRQIALLWEERSSQPASPGELANAIGRKDLIE